MRPPSLAEAVLPSAITEATRPAGPADFFAVADAKKALGMELGQTDQDAHLQALIGQAQAILEKSTGLAFKTATGSSAEYILSGEVRALSIPASDVQAVTSVVEYDDEGEETTLDAGNYTLKRMAGRAYVVRTDGELFPASCDGGLSVAVSFTRGVEEDTVQADLIRAGMAHLVITLYDGRGSVIERGMNNPDYMRVVRLLRTQDSILM